MALKPSNTFGTLNLGMIPSVHAESQHSYTTIVGAPFTKGRDPTESRRQAGTRVCSLSRDAPGSPGGQGETVRAAGGDTGPHGYGCPFPRLHRPLLPALLQPTISYPPSAS